VASRRVGKGAGNASRRRRTFVRLCPPAELTFVAPSMVGTAHESHSLYFKAVPAPVPTLQKAPAKLVRSAGASPARVRPSEPPGSECCVSRRRRRPRSVHSGCVECVIEPRNGFIAGAETVVGVERNMSSAVTQGIVVLPGSKSTLRANGSRRKLGDPASGHLPSKWVVRIGKARSRSR